MVSYRFIAAVAAITFLSALVLIRTMDAPGATPAGCWFGCKYRHPVSTWISQTTHRPCRSTSCRVKRAEHRDRRDRSSSSRSSSTPHAYPCIHRWTYNGLRYWHLHYADGGKGRTHIGIGHGYRRCL